jgi:Uma2 family endonuclease
MSAVMNDWILRHRITVDEYYRMAETGILSPDARVELIEGEIIDMAPMGTDHAGTSGQLSQMLFEAAAARAHVRSQLPLRLSDLSEPMPDFALLRPRADYYKKADPRPEDTLLIIEVSNSSLRFDTQVKAPLYARYNIPELWIVDLTGREIRFLCSPQAGKYTDVTSTSSPGIVSPVAMPEIQIDLTHIFNG